MFGSATNFDMDDLFLGTDFKPVISSTQEPIPSKKRHRDEVENENLKIDEEKALSVNILPCMRALERPSPNVVKRTFPGPAGLLPERSARTNSVSGYNANSTIPDTVDFLFCSQRTVSTFEDGPWSQMTKDFSVANHEALYEKFNISWIKNSPTVKKLLKAPFLAAIIQTIEKTTHIIPTVNVTLKDTTGDIQGTILRSLYEEQSDYFTSGSVIVLKQFGVLPRQNSFCLTITPDNLLAIYNSKSLKEQTNDDTSKSRVIKKILVQEFSIEDIWKRYHEDLITQSNSNTPNSTSLHSNLYLINRMPYVRNSRCVDSFKPPDTYNKSCSRSARKSSEEIVDSIEKFNSHSSKKSEEFKSDFDERFQKSMEFNCSQSVKGDKEHTEIWKNLFEDVDIDSLFDDEF